MDQILWWHTVQFYDNHKSVLWQILFIPHIWVQEKVQESPRQIKQTKAEKSKIRMLKGSMTAMKVLITRWLFHRIKWANLFMMVYSIWSRWWLQLAISIFFFFSLGRYKQPVMLIQICFQTTRQKKYQTCLFNFGCCNISKKTFTAWSWLSAPNKVFAFSKEKNNNITIND